MSQLVHVAVGVIINTDGKVLIAKRAAAAHQGGLWEFPGGKVDAGESVVQALLRELKEELAIDVLAHSPLIQIRHHYGDKSVLLDVHRVTSFSGLASGNEGQPIRWVTIDELRDYEFPAANTPILQALGLPEYLCITGEFSSFEDFSLKLQSALAQNIKLIQLRIKDLNLSLHASYISHAIELTKQSGARLILNCSVDTYTLIVEQYPHSNLGLHLNRHLLMASSSRPISSQFLCSASCHDACELAHAQTLGMDYVLLSPVKVTQSHPEAESLGWEEFTALVKDVNIPVYALGGLSHLDRADALEAGAQGVAAIRCWWML